MSDTAEKTAAPTPGQAEASRSRAGLLTRIEHAGFLAVAGLARALPMDIASSVSGHAWRLIAPRLRRHRRARENIAASLPHVPAAEREAMLLDMWENLGRTFAEAFHLDALAREPDRIVLEHGPGVAEILAARQGCVLAGLHMANWEITGIVAMREGVHLAGVYQRLKNPLVDRDVTRMRERFYPAGLFGKGHDTVMKLMRVVRAGGAVGLLSDLREHRGIEVPFFGRPAPSTPFPALLARAQGVPLIAILVRRTGVARFVMRTKLIEMPRTSDRDADVRAGTAALQACFEDWIRATPSQWMWAHRRWAR